jgi:hypothetical protein
MRRTKVMTLSYEMNRLLGSAALDPELSASILGTRRADALQAYALSPQEAQAILISRASTLPELATELCAVLLEPLGMPQERAPRDRNVERGFPMAPQATAFNRANVRLSAAPCLGQTQPIAIENWPVRELAELNAP